jgi:signal transduction histidine kinase
LVGLPLLLIIAAGGGYVLVRRALSPVELMINAAEAISFNDPHNRLPLTGSGDRIDALGLALNRMLDRLDGAYQHVSRFTADAAHELRTPLAIIRGELEFVASLQKLSAEIQTAIGNVLEEVSRLSAIVDSLIALSRMDSFWGKRTHSAVDISALAAETVEQMQLLAQERTVSLNGPTGGSVLVAGDRGRLKQVLVNLLDNAIKYNVSGGTVSVEVNASADRGLIVVSDSGVGIAPEDTQFIFDRFYRISTDRGESGAGLGLAIVKSICHAHGGSVTVTTGIRGGSVFLVELPLWAEQADA